MFLPPPPSHPPLPLPSLLSSSFSITLNFYLHLLPRRTHSFTHITQRRERGLCAPETKASLSAECELSFRSELTVSEGRGRADDGPRIRYVQKKKKKSVLEMYTFVFFPSFHATQTNTGAGSRNGALSITFPEASQCVCVFPGWSVSGCTEFASAWCELVLRPPPCGHSKTDWSPGSDGSELRSHHLMWGHKHRGLSLPPPLFVFLIRSSTSLTSCLSRPPFFCPCPPPVVLYSTFFSSKSWHNAECNILFPLKKTTNCGVDHMLG